MRLTVILTIALVLVSCASSTRSTAHLELGRGRPASSWSGEVWLELLGMTTPADATVCESAVVQPAVDCGAGELAYVDSCHWRCEPRAGMQ